MPKESERVRESEIDRRREADWHSKRVSASQWVSAWLIPFYRYSFSHSAGRAGAEQEEDKWTKLLLRWAAAASITERSSRVCGLSTKQRFKGVRVRFSFSVRVWLSLCLCLASVSVCVCVSVCEFVSVSSHREVALGKKMGARTRCTDNF